MCIVQNGFTASGCFIIRKYISKGRSWIQKYTAIQILRYGTYSKNLTVISLEIFLYS